MTGKKILVVDDQSSIREMVVVALEMANYTCLEAGSIKAAYEITVNSRPDLILVDWMMPNGSGIELIRRLKKEFVTAEIPIIMLTAKSEENNKIQGLDVGADDYITKPFSPRELVARINAVLRRAYPQSSTSSIMKDGLALDPVGQRVTIHNKFIEMGPTEFRLLKFLMTHQERVYSRAQLLDQVWGSNIYVEERTVDVHIGRLRKVLGESHNYLIQTVRGTGYRFSDKRAG